MSEKAIKNLGIAIKAYRKQHKLTQESLSDTLKDSEDFSKELAIQLSQYCSTKTNYFKNDILTN